MDERQGRAPAAYPLPEATVAGDPTVLGAILAAIVGVLFFWRRKKVRIVEDPPPHWGENLPRS